MPTARDISYVASRFDPQFSGEPVPPFGRVAAYCKANRIGMNIEVRVGDSGMFCHIVNTTNTVERV